MNSPRERLAAFGQPLTASQLARVNPPGLVALSYRHATYENALARMLARLPVETVAPEDAPLANLNVEADDDWAVALVHSWAVVTDVLSFYQERIINEGYLRTATERRSVVELARSIGYELRPGVAAGTHLAFTVQVGHDEPPRRVEIPANTAVQGIPPTGELPQIFETSVALVARSEWNLLRPVSLGVTSWEQNIHPETTSLRLLGNRTDLQPGAPVLILDENEERWRLVRLVAVEPDLERGFTVVRWADSADAAGGGFPLTRPRLFAMRRQAGLFGYTPAGVYLWAEHEIRWRPVGIGLPDTAVQVLLANQRGHLFAATEKDIFRSVDQGATWTEASTGLIEKNITALTVGDHGEIWAGSDEGEVFLSRDDGVNWRAPGGDRIVLPIRGLSKLKKLWPCIVSGPLPKTVIRSLAAYGDGKKTTVAAGTDDGVFLSTNGGKSWKPANISLPKVDRKTGLTKAPTRTVIAAKMGTKKAIFAGTDSGVFRISKPLNIWPIIGLALLLIFVQRLYVPLPKSVFEPPITEDAAQLQVDAVRLQVDAAQLQVDAAQLQVDAATLREDAAQPQVDSATLERDVDKLHKHAAQLKADAAKLREPAACLQGLLDRIDKGVSQATKVAAKLKGDADKLQEDAAKPQVDSATLEVDAATLHKDAAKLQEQAAGLVRTVKALQGAASLADLLLQRAKDLPGQLPSQITAALKPLADKLPLTVPRIEDLFGFLKGPIPESALGVLNALLVFALDVALIVAFLVVVYLAWWWVRRRFNSLSFRCIGAPVYVLAAGPTGQLFAGTDQGLFRSNDPAAWREARGLRRLAGRLAQRLFPGWNRNWVRIKLDADVRALTRTEDQLVVGTAGGGVYRSVDNGDNWASQGARLELQDVQAITVTATGLYAGGTPIDTKVDTQWSFFHLRHKEIHLDAVYSDLAPKGWVLLQQEQQEEEQQEQKKQEQREEREDQKNGEGRSPRACLYRTIGAATAESRDLTRHGPFTNLQVEDSAELDGFDRETASVLVGAQSLELYDDKPVCGASITLSRFVPGLESGHRLIASGKLMRARLVGQPAEHAKLTSPDGLRQVQLHPHELFQVLVLPGLGARGSEVPRGGRWHLRNRDGFEGIIPSEAATFALEPALEEDEVVAETAVVRTVKSDRDHTTIELEQPLRYVYDRPSVAIYGNVIHATHGWTVRDEVLGSGDSSQSNQRFRLRQGPLTFVSAPTPSGVEATLAVQVNGVTWHQVPFLHGLDRDSRAYIVRQDAQGNTSIVFGDGEQGARLPSGDEQITATYRIGLGPEANVPPGSLSQLQTALPGIESVTNPLPATGGVGPEKPARARQNAPLAVRAMRRVVSLADFEDFVRRFAGVGKAQARLLHLGPRDVLHITIADGEGQPIPKTSDLYRMLVQAIEENRGTPRPRVYVDSYGPVYFNLRAKLLIDPDHRERRGDIAAAVRGKISQSFVFDAREFGQDVSASELISLMQNTFGVVAVQLVHLHRSTEDASLAAVLEASLARWHEGRLLPAQMLLVNAPQGITLELEEAV